MRRRLLLVPLLLAGVLIGCSEQTPEEKEAAKYPQPKMMSDEEGKRFMEGHRDPRTGGPPPKTGP